MTLGDLIKIGSQRGYFIWETLTEKQKTEIYELGVIYTDGGGNRSIIGYPIRYESKADIPAYTPSYK